MDQNLRTILWQQFGASIDMLENAITACPEDVWSARAGRGTELNAEGSSFSSYWYISFHTLFWLDLNLSDSVEGFAPPEPFTLSELDPEGILPERVYTKLELLNYLEHCREKCRIQIARLTTEKAQQLFVNTEKARQIFTSAAWRDRTLLELQLYNMRHVQHHAAQLNLILRQKTDSAPHWVGTTKHKFNES
jgi:hypothetical protein